MANGNSFFVLINEPAIELLHIIAIKGTRVYFQIHGAKFCIQTACHQSELNELSKLAQYEYFWTFNSDVLFVYCTSAYRPIGLPAQVFSSEQSQVTWSTALISVRDDDRSIWLFLSLCSFWFSKLTINRLPDLSTTKNDCWLSFSLLFCERFEIATGFTCLANRSFEKRKSHLLFRNGTS
jgi:hypothetical protein